MTTDPSRATGHQLQREVRDLLVEPPDLELDVIVRVSAGNRGPYEFHSFAEAACDLGWWQTMDQSRVTPITITARGRVLTTDGQVRTLGATSMAITGTAVLYDPVTRSIERDVTVPPVRTVTGRLLLDPRTLATRAHPWVFALSLTATASTSHGLGAQRRYAKTVVRIMGDIGSIG